MKFNIVPTLSIFGCALLAVSCAPSAKLLRDDVRDAMAAGHVNKVKLYVDQDGKVEKHAFYVTREEIPDWVIAFADEKIGSGTNEYYELEWYGDAPNTRVYEVTRTIKGKKAEVSVNEFKQLRYIEREIDAAAVPAAVRKAVAGVKGFKASEYEDKKGPGFYHVQAEGMLNGQEATFTFDEDGSLIRKQITVEAEVELTTS